MTVVWFNLELASRVRQLVLGWYEPLEAAVAEEEWTLLDAAPSSRQRKPDVIEGNTS